MNTIHILHMAAIAGGGALGAVARYGVAHASFVLWGAEFPYGTLIVNIVGALAIGLCVGIFAHIFAPSEIFQAFLITGFLGAFTTFSAFSLDAVSLVERGAYLESAFYILGNVILSISAVFAGLWIIRGITA